MACGYGPRAPATSVAAQLRGEDSYVSEMPEDPQAASTPPPAGTPATYGEGAFRAPEAPGAAFGGVPATTDAYASRWLRLAAAIIDGVIVGVPSAIISSVVNEDGRFAITLIYMVVAVLYAPLLLMRKGEHNGQTIGKQAVGIRVVHQSGQPITGSVAALREVVGRSVLGAVTCGFYSLVDSLWCLWDQRRQCLHDKIAGTFVLKQDADPGVGRSLSS
jgi:uncharacterized RDD family membrane protein YckC